MSAVATELLFHHRVHRISPKLIPKFHLISRKSPTFNLICDTTTTDRRFVGTGLCSRYYKPLKAVSSAGAAVLETSESSTITFSETFQLERVEKVEGKITIKLDKGETEECWQLIVGCSIPGKWILHWGVNYVSDVGSEWDQPPLDMRPPGSIPVKDYAIETPLESKSELAEGEAFSEVAIVFDTKSSIASINFVLKDEETGRWYQHRGRDFKVPLIEHPQIDVKAGEGDVAQLTTVLVKPEAAESKGDDIGGVRLQRGPLQSFYEEFSVVKETVNSNSISVSVKHTEEKDKCVLYIETDLPGDVVVHWGVCRDESKKWEIPVEPYPPGTIVFKNKALRTLLQRKNDGDGSGGSFTLGEGLLGFVFVLKLNENAWLNCKGSDFYIPLPRTVVPDKLSVSPLISENASESNQTSSTYTDGIISEIRSLVTDISSEKTRQTKNKKVRESILQEIEKLAAEAYSIFRSSIPTVPKIDLAEDEVLEPPVKVCSGTGSGNEIVCQGFNWESHKSGNWYIELQEKASKLSELGFTVIWLPPPTDSVSPEGYMPSDLYNLNSRYGSIDQLKVLVKKLHEVGIMVLGDAVLNHRCAQFQNQNGVWNIFGGRLNWDDRAIVADDPHFQGRGNKSSGDNFHAAPNIDHSQEFVRKDIREWMNWLREEIGYDGWRLDFVRGFWGGYVKDYMESTEPYFAVGEYWDSLSYTYGEMDHNQDAHRQRIVDWINATNGTAGAFDVTTKGILHSTLERCEYWRLSDGEGKPPGVMGWWPSRAVTFIENHDTGSTQGHWRFPSGKEMQGYAYLLTHPGTPSVFYDHIFSDYQNEISALISVRKRNTINCRSRVTIIKAERDVYAAIVDEKLIMKIGPGHYEPTTGAENWSVAVEGRDYKVWELTRK
ncbi:hypothetical protein ABFS82_05G010800 [Erythranthe guttata]|uniref:alpha-amylase n=1 Tax=Erythranthe guttata TaxID=4155 RepID=A0A022Q5H8_ERYGU|nr:PREDICTED: alpha-amylase 3, chloroplastic [Erythranthe guttata]EYU22438.1 hypothetical protein MIMGU_mgv1a001104mg [Erythranthe guttata]|eukprot:XP_012855272.1 PREDICTED: alpha-amylase 3, chloroplastic [Erythranthe guttata]